MRGYTWRGILDEVTFLARVKWVDRTFMPYVVRKTVGGVVFDFYVGDAESAIWNDTGSNLAAWKEMQFIKDRLILDGDIVFDCGAHHGLTALVFSELVGRAGRVVAFEPHPHNVDIIGKNVSLNRRTNISIERCALGSGEGTIWLRNKSNASVAWRPRTRGIRVDLVSLDQYAAQTGVFPTLIKIDVEGFEAEVLKGARSVLRRSPKLAIEVHAKALYRYGGSFAMLLELLTPGRYDLWVLRGDTVQRFDPCGQLSPDPRFHLFAMPKAS